MFISNEDRADQWRDHLQRELPSLNFYQWPRDEGVDKSSIDYVLVWKPAPGVIKQFPKLKAILSLGAGIDGITCDPELPRDKPIVRLVDNSLAQGMTQFAVYWVIHFHRDMDKYLAFQKEKSWTQLPQTDAAHRRVGILGLGELGQAVGRALVGLQFDVAGWSRSEKTIDGIASYHGEDGLSDFLAETEILICLLPLTAATEGILDAGLLRQLPRGAVLINLARGGHLVEDDLLAVLDEGHLSAAVLDVFQSEPLPPSHPFWDHPNITVTPHIAALTLPHSGARYVADNIKRIESGQQPLNLIDLDKGY